MTCANYMGQSCGIGCCLARAEQFAFFEHNEPEFAEFCPLVQHYGLVFLEGLMNHVQLTQLIQLIH